MSVNPCIVHSWTYPANSSHVFWDNSSVFPQLRKFINSSTEPTLTGATLAAADAITDLQTLLSDRQAAGNTSDFYSLYVHGFADRDDMRGLQNPHDGIGNWIAQGGFDGVTNSTPFISNGLDVCKAWGDAFLDEFKSLLDSNGLPYPSRMHFDTEVNINKSYAARPASDGYDGWMDFAMADPRASTELVDGISTFEQIVNGWTTKSGGTLGWDVNQSYWSEANEELREFLNYYEYLVRDYLHWYAFISYATSLFPGVKWSNWNHGNYGPYTDPTICRSKASNPCYGDGGPYSDFAAPALYPLRDASMSGSGSSKSDWINVLGITSTVPLHGPPYDDEYENLWTSRAIQTVEGLVQHEGASSVMPWINYAGEYYEITNFRDGVTQITINSDDADLTTVGNNLFLLNSNEEQIVKTKTLRLIDNEDGTHTVNVTEVDSGEFASVALCRDEVIGTTFAVSAIAQEPTSTLFHQTRQSGIDTVLERCVALDIREYFFWQNGDVINDAQWISMADGVRKIEDGLGVLLGEIESSYVNVSGDKIILDFKMPANGVWNLDNLAISSALAPTFAVNGDPLEYIQITTSALSITEFGSLHIELQIDSNNVLSGDSVEMTVNENWIYDQTYRFKTSATTNVVSGFDANPETATFEITNESEERNSTPRTSGKRDNGSDRVDPFDLSAGVVSY